MAEGIESPLKLQPSARRTNKMARSADAAYSAIRDAILRGELKLGDHLSERDLAERTGLSRTPVREALNRLRVEGLVHLERNTRNYVAHFSEEDVAEVLELRALVEGHAAARAAARISDSDVQKLEHLAAQMEQLVDEKGDSADAEFSVINHQFHRLIMECADSTRVELVLDTSLSIPFNSLGRFREHMGEHLQRACWYHREVIAALKAGNAERASSQMRAHIQSLITVESVHHDPANK